jgi:hypothetical protein
VEETRTPAVLTAELAPESAQMRLLRSFCQRSEHTEALREPVFNSAPSPNLISPSREEKIGKREVLSRIQVFNINHI